MTEAALSDWETRLVAAIDKHFAGNRSAFARAVGVSYRTVARWCAGEDRPQRESRGRVAAQGPEFAALVAELETPPPRTPTLAIRRLEDEVRELRETVRQLEGQGRFLPSASALPPEVADRLREEVLGTLEKNDRSMDVLERRVDRLERLLPREERGHA